jgi:putative SOS response-associated peptidase YedK
MCNDYRFRHPAERLIDEFREIRLPLVFPKGLPNIEARDDIRIKDTAPVVRFAEGRAELEQLPWAWSAPNGKPVFNFRSEGRRFDPAERVIIPTDGFYEFTTPTDPKQKRKDKWLFTLKGRDLFAIAGIVKHGAFTMLTTQPGPDIAPYHDRQVVVLKPEDWEAWLTGKVAEAELLAPTPAGTLDVARVS